MDLGLTLEYLETKGVPVIGYKTEELPAFFTRKSGFKVNYRLDSVKEIADVINAKNELKLNGSVLITNPIPEEYSLDYDYISSIIEDACKNAEQEGIKGKNITPYLLDKIKSLTAGKSLEANIQLVYNNAKLGAKIACEL